MSRPVPQCPYPLDLDGGCSHHLDDVCQRPVLPQELIVNGVTYVSRPAPSEPKQVYVDLATRLLTHPDVVRALALRLEAEGL